MAAEKEEASNRATMETFKTRLKTLKGNITLEPVVFFIYLATYMDTVSNEQLKLNKCCKIDMGYSDEICNNLTSDAYVREEKLVHDKVAQFNVYQSFVESIFPTLFAFYMGAWCDQFGRKLIFFLCLTFVILGQVVMVLNSAFVDWPKEYMLISFFLPSLVGGLYGFNMAMYAFISDISHPTQRAFRMGCIQLVKMVSKPIAYQIGAFLLREVGFAGVNSVSLVILIVATIFLLLRLRSFKWKPTKTTNASLFSLYHIRDAFASTFRRRAHNRRFYVVLTLMILSLNMAPFIAESSLGYIYTQKRFDWGVDEFSTFTSVDFLIAIFGQLILMPIIARMEVRETLLFSLLTLETSLRHLVQGVAYKPWIYYLSPVVDILGQYNTSVGRAILSICVPKDELGKIMSMFMALEAALPMAFSQMYAEVWKKTSTNMVGAVKYLSVIITLLAVLLSLIMHLNLKGQRLTDLDTEQEEELEESDTEKPEKPGQDHKKGAVNSASGSCYGTTRL